MGALSPRGSSSVTPTVCAVTRAVAGASSAPARIERRRGWTSGVECVGNGKQVAVVDAPVFELVCEIAEQAWPVLAPGRVRHEDPHAPLDDLDGCEAGVGRSGLLPGPLPTRGEHYFGSRAVALTAIGPLGHPQVRAAIRRADAVAVSGIAAAAVARKAVEPAIETEPSAGG